LLGYINIWRENLFITRKEESLAWKYDQYRKGVLGGFPSVKGLDLKMIVRRMGGGRAAGEEKVEQKEQQQCTQGRKVCLRIKLSERKTLGVGSLLYIYIYVHTVAESWKRI
jgi:hypothetical protein